MTSRGRLEEGVHVGSIHMSRDRRGKSSVWTVP